MNVHFVSSFLSLPFILRSCCILLCMCVWLICITDANNRCVNNLLKQAVILFGLLLLCTKKSTSAHSSPKYILVGKRQTSITFCLTIVKDLRHSHISPMENEREIGECIYGTLIFFLSCWPLTSYVCVCVHELTAVHAYYEAHTMNRSILYYIYTISGPFLAGGEWGNRHSAPTWRKLFKIARVFGVCDVGTAPPQADDRFFLFSPHFWNFEWELFEFARLFWQVAGLPKKSRLRALPISRNGTAQYVYYFKFQ